MRIAWFSPINGFSNGDLTYSRAAYCSEVLLPHLSELADIFIFVDGRSSSFKTKKTIPVYNYLNAALIDQENPFDLFLYQLEDHPSNAYIRSHLGLKPGLVWFHSILFTNRAPDPLSHSPWQEVVKQFADLSLQLPPETIWPETNHPYPYREASLLFGALFSQAWAHGEYARKIESGETNLALASNSNFQSAYLPMPLEPFNSKALLNDFQSKHIDIICSSAPQDRLDLILECLSRVDFNNNKVNLRFWCQGNENNQIQKIISNYELKGLSFEILPLAAPKEFASLITNSNLLLFLSFSLYGNPAPYLDLALARGVRSMVTNFGNFEYYQHENLTKVDLNNYAALKIIEEFNLLNTASVPKVESAELCFSSGYEVSKELIHFISENLLTFKSLKSRWEEIEKLAARWVSNQFLT